MAPTEGADEHGTVYDLIDDTELLRTKPGSSEPEVLFEKVVDGFATDADAHALAAGEGPAAPWIHCNGRVIPAVSAPRRGSKVMLPGVPTSAP